jgi:hypothetical protein
MQKFRLPILQPFQQNISNLIPINLLVTNSFRWRIIPVTKLNPIHIHLILKADRYNVNDTLKQRIRCQLSNP